MSDDGERVLVAERVRQLLAEAAEPDVRVRCPGPEFTEQARRGLVRRRAALAAGVAAAVAAGAVAVPFAVGRKEQHSDRVVAAAPAQCVRSAAREIAAWRARGFQPVSGTLRPGAIDLSDGMTEGSGFRFEVDGTLARGPVSSRRPVTVWYPVAEAQLPPPGRYVLLLNPGDRPSTTGERLYDFTPDQVLPIGGDGKVRLDCGRDGQRAVEVRQLRSDVATP
ncbi:hypothetical protein [Streptomyces chattanoogensis]|uniref:hypothetical protein n=1 Tax=Streptomyces chattanoogensis TaxID=66876 RepID=UPI000AB3A651|nr:hypothetical protein [Streptomyces chattanoogensis]